MREYQTDYRGMFMFIVAAVNFYAFLFIRNVFQTTWASISVRSQHRAYPCRLRVASVVYICTCYLKSLTYNTNNVYIMYYSVLQSLKAVSPYSTGKQMLLFGIVFRLQNLMSKDVRFRRLKAIPASKE